MKKVFPVLMVMTLLSAVAVSQGSANSQTAVRMAELISLREKVADADTRTRVGATHRVWTLGVTSAGAPAYPERTIVGGSPGTCPSSQSTRPPGGGAYSIIPVR